MNVLIVDDIKTIGISACAKLSEMIQGNRILFQHFDVRQNEEENISKIFEIIKNENINVLALDRGFSKIYEDCNNNYIYSSILEEDRDIKKKADAILLGDGGLLSKLSNSHTNLKSIIIHTYDKGNSEIVATLIKIEKEIKNALKLLNLESIDIQIIETSTIFNKPINIDIYPNSFYVNPIFKDKFIDYDNKRRNIGTKTTYIEYGELIAYVLKDIIYPNPNNSIYSFNNNENRDFDSFLRCISRIQLKGNEERVEYYLDNNNERKSKIIERKFKPIELNIGSVSSVFSFEGEEKYYIDIPYKEYYENLNNDITKEYEQIYRDKLGKYIQKQYVYFSYNYNDGRYELYDIKLSGGIGKEKEYIAKQWLPFLHCGIFHFNDNSLWKEPNIKKVENYIGERINLFFLIDDITVARYTGHINYTFYNESNLQLSEELVCENANYIMSTMTPLLKAKATDSLIPELILLIRKQTLQTAISQIFARNFAHNIGSHVAIRASNRMLKQRILELY